MFKRKMRPQLECFSFFRVPVTDGVMFLTGDDTTTSSYYRVDLAFVPRNLKHSITSVSDLT